MLFNPRWCSVVNYYYQNFYVVQILVIAGFGRTIRRKEENHFFDNIRRFLTRATYKILVYTSVGLINRLIRTQYTLSVDILHRLFEFYTSISPNHIRQVSYFLRRLIVDVYFTFYVALYPA